MLPGGNASPLGLCEVGNKSVHILMRDFTGHKLLFRHCAHLKFRTVVFVV